MTTELMPMPTQRINEEEEFRYFADRTEERQRAELKAAARRDVQRVLRNKQRAVKKAVREAWLFLCGMVASCCSMVAAVALCWYPPILAVFPALIAVLAVLELFRKRR